MPNNPRLVRAEFALSRRMFVKALAVGLSLPVAARFASIASAAPTPAVKRFFLFYMPHGAPPEHYNPQVAEGDWTNFALDKTNVSILGPLQKYKQYVNVYQGFKYPGGDTHTGLVSCLSGANTVDSTTPRTSVEHVIAKGLGVKPLILGACSHQPYGLDTNGMLFWNGTAVDPEKNPAKVADALFGNTTPTQPANADAELRAALLKLTASEIEGLQGELGSLTSEKTKLQRHLEAIQSMQGQTGGSGVSTCTTKPSLPAVDMVRSQSAGQVIDSSGGNDYFYQEKNFPLLLQAQLEVAAQALLCNAAQVVALMPMYATNEFNFSFSQPAGAKAPPSGWGHHNGLSHTSPQQTSTAMYNSPLSVNNFMADTRADFAKAQLWFAKQLDQYLLQILANTDDPSAPGTKVLDNTLVYWMSEVGDGQNHTTKSQVLYPQVPSYLPLVSIGKAGGGLKSGQVVRYATDRPAGDLYLSLAKAMGVSNASFPGTTGPVTEVLT